jgi:GxxExxY protein
MRGKSTKGYDFDDVTGEIIGAAIEVHRTLGPGFMEVTYQRALALESWRRAGWTSAVR